MSICGNQMKKEASLSQKLQVPINVWLTQSLFFGLFFLTIYLISIEV